METNFTFTCTRNLDIGCFTFFMYFAFAASFLIICESVLVTVIIWRTRNLHTNTDIAVASLSSTDILVCASYITYGVVGINLFRVSDSVNRIIISFVLGTSFGSTFLSVTHAGYVACDRYIHIAHPFYYMKKMTKERNFKVLLAIWVAGLVYAIIPVFAFRDSKYHHQSILLNPPLEYASVFHGVYAGNLVIAFTCYFKIASIAFLHKKAAIVRRSQTVVDNNEIVLALNRKAAFQSVKFFAVSFGVFLICTSPMFFVTLINYFHNVPKFLHVTLASLILVNSLMNSLIYSFMRKAFRKALRHAVTYITQRCHRSTE